ncbi:MAG: sigma-E processing peptidase SpoIIGA, partial [Oscillospiraceae bacterium]|nr:sigma-E processing peptidase SpoIIGA [Oscillospiraceae bacterium]
MRPVLYLDILLVLNFIIDYVLLCTTKAIADTSTKKWRILLASALASLCSLIILAPVLPLWVQFLYKSVTAGLILLVAFPYQGMRQYLKQLFWFLLLSVALAGAVLFFMFSFSLSGV